MRRFIVLVALVSGLVAALARPSDAVTNGQPDGNAHPNVGILVFELTREQGLFCSGTLIAPSVFLTAGHCTALLESLGHPAAWVTFDSVLDLDAESLIPVTYTTHPEFDPRTLKNDLGVAVLARPLAGVAPAELPPIGLLDRMKDAGTLDDVSFTTVGYGLSVTFKEGPPAFSWDGVRRASMSPFAGLTQSSLVLLQNSDATEEGGACYGDSGAPRFLGATNLVVGVTSSGDAVCRAIGFSQRTDTQSARAFLDDFVSLP
jgi:secreted trypsin-like serine protease